MTEQQPSVPVCTGCSLAVEIIAKGLCRKCYDRARTVNEPLQRVEGIEHLSAHARTLLLRAIGHRRRTGMLAGLDQLRTGLPALTQGQALAAARECIAAGAGCYGFMPIYRKVSRKPTSSPSTDTQNHAGKR